MSRKRRFRPVTQNRFQSQVRRPRRRAIVLMVVLITVAIIALGSYMFSDLMTTHREATQMTGRQQQARYIVEAGTEFLKYFLTQDEQAQLDAGGVYDNMSLFMAQAVSGVQDDGTGEIDPRLRGNFTIIAPALDEMGFISGIRYGLEDESVRLNLNSLLAAEDTIPDSGRTLLMAIPGMTEDVADSILDWIDEDDEPREYGAELEYYSTLDPPYAPANGPLKTVEELLLVRGVTPSALYGLDTNRNGIIDPHEGSSSSNQLQQQVIAETQQLDSTTGSLDRGWGAYFTLYSQEQNKNTEGDPRIFLNNEDLSALHKELSEVFSEDLATFVVAYRMGSDYSGTEPGELANGRSLDVSEGGQRSISSSLDLIGAKVEVQFENEPGPTVLVSPITEQNLGQYAQTLFDNTTVNSGETIAGRVNINECSRTIMMGVPGMTEEIADAILEARLDAQDEEMAEMFRTEAWLLLTGTVTLDEMKLMLPFVNAGGSTYRAQIIGYFEDGSASARAEVIIDGSGAMPRVVSWKDITHLGRGYPLEILGLSTVAGVQ